MSNRDMYPHKRIVHSRLLNESIISGLHRTRAAKVN